MKLTKTILTSAMACSLWACASTTPPTPEVNLNDVSGKDTKQAQLTTPETEKEEASRPTQSVQTTIIDNGQSPNAQNMQESGFSCATLYTNYEASMLAFQPKKKKKKSFLSRLGSSTLGSASAIGLGAMMGGADPRLVQNIVTGAEIVGDATQTRQNVSLFTNATSTMDVSREAYKLALNNGCDVAKLQTITEKFGE